MSRFFFERVATTLNEKSNLCHHPGLLALMIIQKNGKAFYKMPNVLSIEGTKTLGNLMLR